jgi:membrane protein YqaA with SNARE-associated domain
MIVPSRFQRLFSRGEYVDDEGNLNIKRLLFHTALLMILLFAFYWGAYRLFVALGWNHNVELKKFIDDFGVRGVAGFVFIVDLLVMPMSVDLIWPFVAHWSFAKAVLVLGTASVAGAMGGYFFGRLVGLTPLFKGWVTSIATTETRDLINRYGIWAIVISGLTPLPFSTVCIASGVLRLGAGRVLLASGIRYVRMGFYYLVVTRLFLLG